MKRNLTAPAMLAAAFLALAPVGAIATATPAAAQTKVTFGGSVTWLGQVPIMVAIEKGFFKEQGLEVDYKVILSSYDRLRAITTGDVDFSNLGRAAVIPDMARGNDAFYYFANIDDSPGNEGCWARPGIDSVAGMKGKKVAANSSAEITLHGMLAVNGMTVKDLSYLNLPPNEMAGALSKGDVDVACVWQPLLDGLKAAVPNGKLLGTDKDTANFKKYGTMASPDIVVINKKLADSKPDIARKITIAMFKGADYTNSNPAETAAAVAHYFKKPAAEVEAGIRSFKYFGSKGWEEHMKLHQAQMQELTNWLHSMGRIPSAPDVSKWANYSFVPKS
ncbi:MAG: aliphatic sulfonate ABC transporter substrate-binding protein [Thalassobaculales bacterium]